MSPLNFTVGDVLDGVKACGRGDGVDGTPYGVVDLGLAAGVPSAVIVLLILVVGYQYLDALRDMLGMVLTFLSRHLSAARGSPGGQGDVSFELPELGPPVGQGPAPGVPVLSESVLVDIMPAVPAGAVMPPMDRALWI